MDLAPLIGSAAAFVAALAFLVRAATPAIVQWMNEDTRARGAMRAELAALRTERDALERRNQILEMRAALSAPRSDA